MSHRAILVSLAAVFLCGWALRLGLALAVQYQLDHHLHREFLIPGDANGYWELAGKIVAGEDYALYTPPRYALRMPGLPAILAFSRGFFGPHLLPAKLILATIGALGILAVYWLGTVLENPLVGLLAAFLVAFQPHLAGFSVLELSETPFAVAMTISLVMFVKLVRSHPLNNGIWTALQLGFWTAIATYMRPTWLLAGPGMAGAIVFMMGLRGVIPACAALLALGVCMAPWTIRNGMVAGHGTPTTLWAGPSLYDGLNPDANGDSNMAFFDTENLLANHSEYEVDQIYRQRAYAWAAANPGKTVQLAFAKLARTWNPFPNAEQFRNPLLAWAVAIPFLLAMGFAAIGLRVSGFSLLTWVTLVPVVYFTALHMIFVGSVRYRLPGEYPLAVLGAVGIAVVFGWRIAPTIAGAVTTTPRISPPSFTGGG